MPQTTVTQDEVTGAAQRITFTLTADERNIASAAVASRAKRDAAWTPWKVKSYKYDKEGRPTKWTLTWAPDCPAKRGEIASISQDTAYAFDEKTALLTVITTDAEGRESKEEFDLSRNSAPMVSQITRLNNRRRFEYDSLGRLVRRIDAEGNATSIVYAMHAASGGNTATSTDPTGYIVQTTLDALGRMIKVCDNGDPTRSDNTISRTLKQTADNPQGALCWQKNELGLKTVLSYDSYGRPVRSVDPLDNVEDSVFDDAAMSVTTVVNKVPRQTTISDGMGRVRRTDQYGDAAMGYSLRTVHEYDGLGRNIVTKVMQVPNDGAQPVVLSETSVTHDPDGKPQTRTVSGMGASTETVTETFTYDLMGNQIQMNKRFGKELEIASDVSVYDSSGRIRAVTNGLGQTESFAYDADGRLASRTRPDGSTTTYAYDRNGVVTKTDWGKGCVRQTYLANGRVATVSTGAETISYRYSRDGSALAVVFPDNSRQIYRLDAFSRVVSQTDALGTSTDTTFDRFGRLESRRQGRHTLKFTYGDANNRKGVLVGRQLEGDDPTTWSYTYDGFGALCATTVTDKAEKTLLHVSYQRDANQRLVAIRQKSDFCQAANLAKEYHYSGLGRLTEATTTVSGRLSAKVSYAYDANGNVVRVEDTAGTILRTFNAANQLIRIQGGGTTIYPVYDRNGRMTDDGSGTVFRYNGLDQLVSVGGPNGSVATYSYYPDGALAAVQRGQATRKFYYNSGTMVAMAAVDGGTPEHRTSFFLSNGDRILATEGSTSTRLFTAGTSTTLLTGGGTVTALDYSPYGEPTAGGTAEMGMPFTWNQEYNDPTSGLVYLRARWYNPRQMAFISPDPLFTDNRYNYASGNPISLYDPTGESSAEVTGLVIGAIVGIGVTAATGGVAGAAAAMVFGPECIAASIAATALAGGAGSLAGDAAYAGIAGQEFTMERALVAFASGAAGSGVGAALGGAAGRYAMARALANGKNTVATIVCRGMIVSGTVGGLAGAAATSGVHALAYRQPFFSSDTLLSMAVGGFAGMAGGFLASGAYLGNLDGRVIPVPMTEAEMGQIFTAKNTKGHLSKELMAFASQAEGEAVADTFMALYAGNIDAALTLTYQPGAQTFDTIAAHGMGNTLMLTLKRGGTSSCGRSKAPSSPNGCATTPT